jgi:hypothetical protein
MALILAHMEFRPSFVMGEFVASAIWPPRRDTYDRLPSGPATRPGGFAHLTAINPSSGARVRPLGVHAQRSLSMKRGR